jgi:small subunit ribosomal protein S13
MPRIGGVDVPDSKRIVVGLTYLYGVGPTRAVETLAALGIDGNIRGKALTSDQISRIQSYVEVNYVVEGQLRRQEAQNINRLKAVRCYRGLRHMVSLPVRGQRTRTNARTRKGPRKTVAGKKGVKEMR